MKHLTTSELINVITSSNLGENTLKGLDYNLNTLAKMTQKELENLGFTKKQAQKIEACFELGRRKEGFSEGKKAISSSQCSYKAFIPYLTNLDVEHFYVMLLNRANNIIAIKKISEGGIAGTVADPKIIFNIALQYKASAIIVAHNHPSGNKKPSQADIDFSKRLKKGGELLDISVLDSLILTDNGYCSLADEGIV